MTPIYAPIKAESKFDRELPKAGPFRAVCIGVWDLGIRDDDYQGTPRTPHEIMFSWEIDQRMTGEGEYKDKRFVMSSRRFTLSFGEKANLTTFVQNLLGKEMSEDERASFDLSSVKGMSVAVTISHTVAKNGKTYANIMNVAPLMQGLVPLVAETNWDIPPKWIQEITTDGWTIKDSDSAMCKMAKCELLVAKEEADKTEKPVIATTATTSEAEAIGAESTAELIAECDAEKAVAQAETTIPFGDASEDVTSLSEPEMILKIRKLCMELKIEVQKHIAAVLGSPITTDKLTKEQAEKVLLELIKIKQSQESFTEDTVPM